jgi:hypothetical protein
MIVLLIAAAVPSCKSPISPTPAGPTLTLILPDSAHALDSVTLRAHYSDSIKPAWDYAWQFGDSAKATTRDTSISHIYDSAGTYTIQVALTDTVLHQTIAKQTGQIKIMPLNGPTLTLTVPDTNYWGDSCVMNVSSSQPLKAGWKFSWSLGDSTTVTGTDSVLHYYLTPGNYKVTVSLNDTVHHILLASKSAIVPVVARHFNLALLQSMKYVDYYDYGTTFGASSNGSTGGYWSVDTSDLLVWKGLSFSWGSSYHYSQTSGSDIDSAIGSSLISGSLGSLTSHIILFEDTSGASYSDYQIYGSFGGFWTNTSSGSYFNVSDIPFIEESDSDVVFQSCGKLIKASSTSSFPTQVGIASQVQISTYEVWSDPNSRIIIRFHK